MSAVGDDPQTDPAPEPRDEDVLAKLREASEAADASQDYEELPDPMPFELPAGDVWTRQRVVTLLGLTLLAAALRLFGLAEWSFWVDEAHTLRDASAPADRFWQSYTSNYPVAYVILRSVIDYLPDLSEGWLRLPYAFFGILTVPLVAIVGRGIVGWRAAALGALLLAVDPWHIYWSQNARAYAVMLPLAVAGVGLLWTAVQRASRWFYVASFAFVFAAGMTHPTAFLLLSLWGLVIFLTLWHKPGVYRTALIVWTSALAVVAAGIGWALAANHVDWVQSAKSAPSMVHFVQTSAFFFRAPLSLAAIGGLFALRVVGERPASWFLGIWAFVPLAILTLLSCGLFQVTAQYGFFCLPAFCLLAGALCVATADSIRASNPRAKIIELALPVILVMDFVAYDVLYFTSQHGDRPRWRDAALHVMQDCPDEGLVLTTNEPSMLYYLHPQVFFGAARGSGRITVRSVEAWDIEAAGGGATFMQDLQIRATRDRFDLYFVLTEPEFEEKDVDGSCAGWLHENAHLVRRYPAWVGPKDMTVYVYEIPRL